MEMQMNIKWAPGIHPAITMRKLWEEISTRVEREEPELWEIMDLIDPETDTSRLDREEYVNMVDSLATTVPPERFRARDFSRATSTQAVDLHKRCSRLILTQERK